LLNLVQNLSFSHAGVAQELLQKSTVAMRIALKGLYVEHETAKVVRTKAVAPEIGPIASGPLVVTLDDFIAWLKSHNRKLHVVEMEAAGVANATYQISSAAPSISARHRSKVRVRRRSA
jgi:nucleoside phosphorylase